MVWENENFDVDPFYRNDFKASYPNNWNLFEYIRNGLKPDWQILQEFESGNNDQILEALENNCSSVRLEGLELSFETDLKDVIPGIINIYLPALQEDGFNGYKSWLESKDVNFSDIRGGINFQPLSICLDSGLLEKDWKDQLENYYSITRQNLQYKILNINASIFEESGASIVQQLAYSISQGVEYLNVLSEKGENIDQISAKVLFEMPIGTSFFMEMSKIRALRILWARILQAYSPEHHCSLHTYVIGTSSKLMYGSKDDNTNLIRNTNSAISAALGNCNEIWVRNHDGLNTTRSYRLARNIQNLIKEESFLNKVIDPSSGSHYIENLTYNLVHKAWDLFMKTEMTGGFIENLRRGNIQSAVRSLAEKKIQALNNGNSTHIGNNKYLQESDQSSNWELEEKNGADFEALRKIICN